MAEQSAKGSRPWQEIARELTQETNRERISELARELSCAFDEQILPDGNHPATVPSLLKPTSDQS